jgi:cell division protein FtsA
MWSLSETEPRERKAAMGRQGAFAALDVGTTKVTCFIAKPEPSEGDGPAPFRVVGIGHQVSRGIHAGIVVDMAAAEEAIRSAVDAAERMAGLTISRVFVNVSSPTMESTRYASSLVIGEREVEDADVSQVLQIARAQAIEPERTILHAIPSRFTVDGSRGIRDPRGLFGGELQADLAVISAAQNHVRNLTVCVERCHLEIAGLIATPYASALASLVDDEIDLGVTAVDMGGGTTSVAVFSEGRLQYSSVIPIGGNHVTSDIAQGLSTPIAHAERMKTLYGSALASVTDEREMIAVPQVGHDGDEDASQIARSMLVGIIQPRVEETLELVRDALIDSGVRAAAGRRVVLTGGACQLPGVRELAQRVLDQHARIGRPLNITGIAEATGGPAFAACAGLIAFPTRAPREAPRNAALGARLVWPLKMERIGRWLGARN